MSDMDLGTLRGHVDLDINQFDRKYGQVDTMLDQLARRQVTDPTIDADITKAERKVAEAKRELDVLGRMEATPEVEADTARAQAALGKAEARLNALEGIRADMVVDADTTPATDAFEDVEDAAGESGDESGRNMMLGILAGLAAIPVVGAVVKIGSAIGKGILDGIQDGLQIEATRDLFSARTGLDESTTARFGRAAGEAYANAFGESTAANLDTARLALQQGLIDEDATQREIQTVVSRLSAITDVFDYDIPAAARGVGQLLKTGMVADAEEAFDLITRASQGVMSDDLMDTLNEYASQFETVGLTAEQAFGLIRQGLDAGARDTDKVADAIKEMGLRIREGTDPAITALDQLGLKPQEIVAAFQKGGPEAAEALGTVLDSLRELEEDGGNTQAVIANLFGGPGEDLGAALFALDLDTATDALGETKGAAQDLLDTLTDNAATDIEKAKRNIELAVDGIKGALAAAFSDDISSAAEWVQTNRGPIMEFLADVVNGFFNLADTIVETLASGYESFASFAAEAGIPVLNMLGDIAEGIDRILPGDQGAQAFREFTDDAVHELAVLNSGSGIVADQMRESMGGAIDGMRDDFNNWIGPSIMAAHVHDAVTEMTLRLDEFSAFVDDVGGTVKINGDTLNAEDALTTLIGMIDEETGKVTINGETVPAEDALDELMDAISDSEDDVTITADRVPADQALQDLMRAVENSEDEVTIGGRSVPAERVLERLRRAVRGSEDEVTIDGRDYPAQRVLDGVLRSIRRGEESVTIDGNDHDAQAATRALLRWVERQDADIDVDADTSRANTKIAGLVNSWRGVKVGLNTVVANTGGLMGDLAGAQGFAAGGGVPGFPTGGEVFGPGTTVSDSILARLSAGEYVVRADMVDYYGRDFLDAINGGTLSTLAGAGGGGARPVLVKVYVQASPDAGYIQENARVVVDDLFQNVMV